MKARFGFAAVAGLGLMMVGGMAMADGTLVQLPDSSSSTKLEATVAEQCHITVPATIGFNVTDITSSTASAEQAVTITNIALLDGHKLKVSIQAAASSFTAPATTNGQPSTTWVPGDVTWTAPTFTAGCTGASGTLSSSAYQLVGTSGYGSTDCSATNLVFTLAAKPGVQRADCHMLTINWKVESVAL